MTPVFLDTVGILAVWDRSDQWHAAAHAAFQRLLSQGRPSLTTTFVLLECGNAASRKPYRSDVDDLRQALEARGLLVTPTESDWRDAWVQYRRGDAAAAGIVDHVSFIVMRRLGIAQAFTTTGTSQRRALN